MPPILELNAFELGQILALLPDVAWQRMDADLRRKIKAAKEKITNTAQDMATLAVEE